MKPTDLIHCHSGGLLLDFDGPVAEVFGGGTSVWDAAAALFIRTGAPMLPIPDPFPMLHTALNNPGPPDDPSRDPETIAAELEAIEAQAMRTAPPAPGGLEVIRRWWGRPLAIVSNNAASPIRDWLRRHDVADPVHWVQGRELRRLKPNPWPLQMAARRIGVLPEHCTFIGDALTDGVAAEAAGMRFIGLALSVDRQVEFHAQGIAETVIDSMADLLTLPPDPGLVSPLPGSNGSTPSTGPRKAGR